MSKALVIKGASFDTNKVTTINFTEDIPCTGIELNSSSLSMSYNSTQELVATVTPNNTTDSITWSTSNANVATVTNGTITGVGIGTATITVTCGSHTDTCDVVVSASSLTGTEVVGGRISVDQGAASGGNGLCSVTAASKFGTLAQNTGLLSLYTYNGSLPDAYYPNAIPKNTGKIKVTQTGSDITSLRFAFFNSATNAGNDYPTTVKCIYAESVSLSETTYEYPVQNYTGFPDIDSFVISFGKGSIFTSEDFSNITVEFVPVQDT